MWKPSCISSFLVTPWASLISKVIPLGWEGSGWHLFSHGFLGCCSGPCCSFCSPFQILSIVVSLIWGFLLFLNWCLSVAMFTVDSRTFFLTSGILFKATVPENFFFSPALCLYVYLHWISFVDVVLGFVILPVTDSCEIGLCLEFRFLCFLSSE